VTNSDQNLQRLGGGMITTALKKLRSIHAKWVDRFTIAASLLAYSQIQANPHKNPITAKGACYFSQNDEDGITLELIKRLGIEKSVFVELGVGDGLENNTIILLASGWKGVWLGGEQLAFDNTDRNTRLAFGRAWIDRDNVSQLITGQLAKLGCSASDVEYLSIDLDGNEAYLIPPLLGENLKPSIIVCEYNGKYPPPLKFSIAYDAKHEWDYSDYQGASLQHLIDEFSKYGYTLICCNMNGVNGFFVRNDKLEAFKDINLDASEIFIPANFLARSPAGHKTSPKTMKILVGGRSLG
jgi:hypothetical protein